LSLPNQIRFHIREESTTHWVLWRIFRNEIEISDTSIWPLDCAADTVPHTFTRVIRHQVMPPLPIRHIHQHPLTRLRNANISYILKPPLTTTTSQQAPKALQDLA
jgi:hypothetical protein